MNKNALIGFLVAIVVIGGGYFLYKNKSVDTDVYQAPVTNTTPPVIQTPGGTTPPPTTPPVTFTPSVPSVTTGTNTSVSNSTAVVTGQVTPHGAPVTYWFDYGTTTSFGFKTTGQALGSGYVAINTPAYITGLKASTRYYFRLNAKNAFGTVSGETYNFTTNTNPPPQVKAPGVRTNSAVSISRTEATVSGTVTPNGLSTNYWFEFGTTTNLGGITSIETLSSTTSATNVSAQLTTLQPLTKYYFRLNAQNQFGTVIGTTLSFTTTGPSAAKAPTATTTNPTNVTSTSARFTGRVNPNGVETTYWFEYSKDSLLGTLIGNGTTVQTLAATNGLTSVLADVAPLTKNSTYYYRLVSKNSFGTVSGDIVSFKTKQ